MAICTINDPIEILSNAVIKYYVPFKKLSVLKVSTGKNEVKVSLSNESSIEILKLNLNPKSHIKIIIRNLNFSKDYNISIDLQDVKFPLTITETIYDILCESFIKPILISTLDETNNPLDGNNIGTIHLRGLLNECQKDFYSKPLKADNISNNYSSISSDAYSNANQPIAEEDSNKNVSDDFVIPKFDDEFEIRSRPDRFLPPTNTEPPNFSYGDRDLYPMGQKNPLSDPTGMKGLLQGGDGSGGMYPTSSDPLFRGQGGNAGPSLNGLQPNVRYDDPLLGPGSDIDMVGMGLPGNPTLGRNNNGRNMGNGDGTGFGNGFGNGYGNGFGF